MGRPITVVVGPLASATATGAAVSQTVPGARYMALSGTLTNGQTANNVCQSQTPAGAGNLTLNGTLCSSVPTGAAVAYLGSNQRIYIVSGSDISNRTFTITGTFLTAGGLVAQTETLTGPNASRVASQQRYYSISQIAISGAAAGALTVGRAGSATMDAAREVVITSGGDDSALTFTISGTDWAGTPLTEVVTGANAGAATSKMSFLTVTDVLTSGAAASTVTVGSAATASSPYVRFEDYAANAQTTIAAVVSGTVNYDLQTSMDDPNAFGNVAYASPSSMTWIASLDSAVVGATATKSSFFTYTPIFARVRLNSGTGSVTTTFRQPTLY